MATKLTPQQDWINRQWWLAGIDFDVELQQARDEGRVMDAIEPCPRGWPGRWAVSATGRGWPRPGP